MYPYIPKSTAHIKTGDYWDINVDDLTGFGCCICVISRVTLIAGITSHIGVEKVIPQNSDITFIDYGGLHVKSIAHLGGMIRGNIVFKDPGLNLAFVKTYGYQVPGILVRKLVESLIPKDRSTRQAIVTDPLI